MNSDESKFYGPAWDIDCVYPGLDSEKLKKKIQEIESGIAELESLAKKLEPFLGRNLSETELPEAIKNAQSISKKAEELEIFAREVGTYAGCITSVDTANTQATAIVAQMQGFGSSINQNISGLINFILELSSSNFETYLGTSDAETQRFNWEHERKQTPFLLSKEEESLLSAMETDGLHAWGNLYTKLTGDLKVDVDGKSLGLAQAANELFNNDEKIREKTWKGIQKSLESQKESFASILNSLAGWRLSAIKARSKKHPLHFLDPSLHQARIERATLDALFEATENFRPIAQRGIKQIAKMLGKDKISPWDLHPPLPEKYLSGKASQFPMPFSDAMALIEKAYSRIHPEMGNFVKLAHEKKWVDGRVSSKRKQGGYCTRFPISNTPRIFMTYKGSISNVETLAHELGHAFHGWMLRDLPYNQTRYPMTLAETASVFGEAALEDYLDESANSKSEKLLFAWNSVQRMATFTLNIPTRFEFEKNFYERRVSSPPLSPAELCDLMKNAWSKWYGDTLDEGDKYYWASKLHFSISNISFYNYPYLFGYLFSLGVYSQREKLGEKFFPAYVDLLKDTGRMTAEDLVKKHLDMDITKTEFWSDSLKIAGRSVEALEKLQL